MRLLLSLLLALGLATSAIAAGHAPTGLTILTVGGDLPNPNAPGADPEANDFIGYLDIGFANAYAFDDAALGALGMHEVNRDIPGPGAATYSGPLLSDVMTAAGAEGKTATLTAFDGYRIEIDWATMTANGPIVAIRADGAPLAIGRYGPTMIVFPPVADAEVNTGFEALQIWTLFLITVD